MCSNSKRSSNNNIFVPNWDRSDPPHSEWDLVFLANEFECKKKAEEKAHKTRIKGVTHKWSILKSKGQSKQQQI